MCSPQSPRPASVSGRLVLWFSDGSVLRVPVECCDPMAALRLVSQWFFGRLDAVSVSLWVRSSVAGAGLVRFAHKSRVVS